MAIATTGGAVQLSRAVQLADGSVSFVQVPRLIEAYTYYKDVRLWGATYYFQLSVPAESGEPLQRVLIQQYQGFDEIDFELDETYAYVGKDEKQRLSLGEVSFTPEGGVMVNFNPPVPPGTDLTVALRPEANPDTGGTYLFGVTAFPPGEKVRSQFLGYGRLQFYDSGDRSFFWDASEPLLSQVHLQH